MTDLCYWFIIPLFVRYLRIGLLVMGAAFLFGITTAEGLVAFYDDGHGPLARLPLWLQAAIFLVGSDFMMYWLHRAFHRPVLDRAGSVLPEKTLEVQGPRGNVVVVSRGMERESYSCTPDCERRITLGDGSTFDAVIAQSGIRNGQAQGGALPAK